VVITTRGSADVAGIKRFGEELITEPRFRAGSRILVTIPSSTRGR
jgi:hypothetical protein